MTHASNNGWVEVKVILAVMKYLLKQLQIKPNGIWTHDFCHIDAMLYQLLSYDRWTMIQSGKILWSFNACQLKDTVSCVMNSNVLRDWLGARTHQTFFTLLEKSIRPIPWEPLVSSLCCLHGGMSHTDQWKLRDLCGWQISMSSISTSPYLMH